MIAAAVSMHNNSLAMTRNCSVRDTTATTSGAFTPLNTQWLWTQSYVQEWHNDKLYIKQFSIANAWIKLIRCSFMLVHSPFQCTTAECWTLKISNNLSSLLPQFWLHKGKDGSFMVSKTESLSSVYTISLESKHNKMPSGYASQL